MADEEKTLQLKLLFDNKGALKAIEGMGKSFSNFEKKSGSVVKKEGGIINDLIDKLGELKKGRDAANDVKSISVFNKKIKETSDQVKKLTETQGENTSASAKFGAVIKSVLNPLAAIVLSFTAIKKAADFVKESYMEYAQSQKQLVLLSEAFSQNGIAAREATSAFEKFASAQQEVTKYSDDEIISAGRFMEAVSGLSEQGLEKATLAAMNFASATGTDLKGAMEGMTSASEGGSNIFTKYGVKLDDTMTRSQKLEAITKQLQDRFGEFAEKEGQTIIGQMAILENSYGDLKKQMGAVIALNVLTGGGQGKGILASLIEGVKLGVEALEVALVLGRNSIKNFVNSSSFLLTNFGVFIKSKFDIMAIDIKSLGKEMQKSITFDPKSLKIISLELALLTAQRRKATAEQTKAGIAIQAIRAEDSETLKKLGLDYKTGEQALIKYFDEREANLSALQAMEEKAAGKRIETNDSEAQKEKDFLKELEDAELKTVTKRIQYIDMLIAKHKDNAKIVTLLNKEKNKILEEQDAAYNDFVLEENENQVRKIKEQSEELLKQQKDLRDQGIISEQEYQTRAVQINETTAKKISQVTGKLTQEQQSMLDGITGAISKMASLIGGGFEQIVNDVMGLIKGIASGDPFAAITAGLAMAVNLIAAEIKKYNLARELEQSFSMKRMSDIELAGAEERIRILEGEHAKQNALLAKRQEEELKYFDNYSVLAIANKAVQDQLEAEKVAAMDATEKARYDIQKKYDDERAALVLRQEEEKKAQEATQKAQRNAAKEKQFNAQKRIQIAQARIDRESAKSQIHKEFWAPWDSDTRNSLLGQIDSMYGDIISAMESQAFIPEYAKGTDSLSSDQLARVHQGERIIPASMNLPGISNSQLMQSAVRGMNGGNRYTTNNNQSSTSQNFGFAGANFNLQGVQDPRSLLLALQREANSMGSSLLR